MGPMSRRKSANMPCWYWEKMSLGRKYKTRQWVKRSFGAMGVKDGMRSKGSYLDFLVRSACFWANSAVNIYSLFKIYFCDL